VGSEELADAGADLVVQGMVEMAAGEALGEEARDAAAEGILEMAEGAADLGAAAALDETTQEDQATT
jgi:hypothetical protein